MLRPPASPMGTAGEDLPWRLPLRSRSRSAMAMPGRFGSACGRCLVCKAAAAVSSPRTLCALAGRAIQLQGFLREGFAAFLPLPPAQLPPSLCSERGGRLLSPFIPRPQISGGGRAAGRHRTDTCVPDPSSCARDTPSICGTCHVLPPVAFPGAGWERSRGRWEGGSHSEIFKQRFAS